jgi:monooxygenase
MDYDVVVIGAGLSGVCVGYYLKTSFPGKSFVILEGRSCMGGTWEFFKYPGMRCDSDMYTLSYPFYPWKSDVAIADSQSILAYIEETAAKFGVDQHIQYNTMVTSADWSDAATCWRLQLKPTADNTATKTQITARVVIASTGYYKYAEGYTPDFPNVKVFKGAVVHPQFWDTNLDYAGKKVVVIGSGATAITVVPAMAEKAAKVTMLQRSPTYVVNVPQRDALYRLLRKLWVPASIAWFITRWKNVARGTFYLNMMRRYPNAMKKALIGQLKRLLPAGYDLSHFTPRYNPWDQRLCAVPDADLFKCINKGTVEIVTDEIETFTETGILLKSGKKLDAEVVVTATGLVLESLGGMKLSLNGVEQKIGDGYIYRGVMFSDLPNFVLGWGANAYNSWTLKLDLNCQYIVRVLRYMDAHGYKRVTPRAPSKDDAQPLLTLSSGYVARAQNMMPKQGSKAPWRMYQNHFVDLFFVKWGSVSDQFLEYK